MESSAEITFDVSVLSGAVCALGVFDGVHRGHEFIIDSAINEAKAMKAPSVIVTFDIDPDEIFAVGRLQKLMTNDARIKFLSQMGAAHVLILPFTREFASQSPKQFLDCLFGKNTPISIHVGKNFRFGSMAKGGVSDLCEWGRAHGLNVYAHDMFTIDGEVVSSTKIRELLNVDEDARAHALLGHPL